LFALQKQQVIILFQTKTTSDEKDFNCLYPLFVSTEFFNFPNYDQHSGTNEIFC
jgi:hypothetical protein